MPELDDIVSRLKAIDEELTEASMAILSEALQGEPDQSALDLEKRIVRARRAIEKATGLLEPTRTNFQP